MEHPAIDWKNIAGLRDVLIHAYFRIDNDLLWDIIQNKLEDLRDEVLKISE
ncbi:HepT-like ribonuclease domain-containing protein [Methanolacinia paynteri]|uniref:HepT-like ribonuclease domain-containing protein n=1 Tax=Methanolacinia paynteri TaxID=230356 RepID=UPI001FE10283|nr:HepT-like ribonuclease domain-containing protein [Methanolacinia paynteri]